MSKAANELYVSQPAISKSINDLETELETNLFTRINNTITLNEQGKILLKYTNEIFKTYEEAKKEIRTTLEVKNNLIEVELKVGTDLFTEIILNFLKEHEDISISINNHNEITNNYDLSVYSSYVHLPLDHNEIILKEKILVGVSLDHPLAKYNSVSLNDLKNEKFILLNNTNPLRTMIDYYCESANFKPRVFWETNDTSLCRSLVREGLAVSFFPEKSWQKHYQNIKMIEIEDYNFYRYLMVSWKPNTTLSKAVVDFKNHIINHFK